MCRTASVYSVESNVPWACSGSNYSTNIFNLLPSINVTSSGSTFQNHLSSRRTETQAGKMAAKWLFLSVEWLLDVLEGNFLSIPGYSQSDPNRWGTQHWSQTIPTLGQRWTHLRTAPNTPNTAATMQTTAVKTTTHTGDISSLLLSC